MRNFLKGFKAKDITDLGIHAIMILDNLQKGDTFELSGKKYEMGNLQKNGFTWLIDGKRKKVNFMYGAFLGGLGHGYDYLDQIRRDIEGVLIVDWLNIFNPFHEKSDLFKILMRDEEFMEYYNKRIEELKNKNG